MKTHSNWGRLGSFACAGCEQEVTAIGDVVQPAGLVSGGLAVCKICALRMEQQPQYREEVTRRAADLTRRALVQRIADALGLTPVAVSAAWARAKGSAGLDQHMDTALGLRPGQFDAAVWFAVRSYSV